MLHLKIVLIGPCQSGKTTIANFISDSTENVGGEYRPTQGVRIVEFETQNLGPNNNGQKAEIELWDCSGDFKFKSLWPAMYKDTQGVVFVYDSTGEDPNRLDQYYESFVNQNNNSSKHCLIVENNKNIERRTPVRLSDNFSDMVKIAVNVEENGQQFRTEFHKYVSRLLSGVRDRNEQDELNILTVP